MMTPMSVGLRPTVSRASTSCVASVASVGFVIREPFSRTSRDWGMSPSVFTKQAFNEGSRRSRSQQELRLGLVQIVFASAASMLIGL